MCSASHMRSGLHFQNVQREPCIMSEYLKSVATLSPRAIDNWAGPDLVASEIYPWASENINYMKKEFSGPNICNINFSSDRWKELDRKINVDPAHDQKFTVFIYDPYTVWETTFLEHLPKNICPLLCSIQNSTHPGQFSSRPAQNALASIGNWVSVSHSLANWCNNG